MEATRAAEITLNAISRRVTRAATLLSGIDRDMIEGTETPQLIKQATEELAQAEKTLDRYETTAVRTPYGS
jgi:hypothetical protein